ncbi:serine/threonine protein phosphatase [Paenibacillus pectinilyticus]|uniref:Serine/threonine protein phosphatase n=1 Tax=Paenibacillus pectinilyticus TaxID=512399 RepID=A0A1C0ZV35_9BACL|nr:metallophosphoesterase family protein [Paenibacillus pectinilyticus]OCT11937.1 serine/threonine protein phosphatase [Paenibacillus pectinilyticus]
MERIAIISDIHGNLPALEAVLQDIERRGLTRILCLGDLVGKGPSAAEVVDLVRTTCESVVQGNWDLGITDPQEQPAGIWQQQALGEARLDYLKQLPFSIDITLSGKRIRLFHASAKSVFHRLKRKASKKERLAMFQHTKKTGIPVDGITPDMVGYGDIHIPYLLTLNNPSEKGGKNKGENTGPRSGLQLFNVGSVGLPYDGLPQACYCIIEGEADPDAHAGFALQFVRVPYDIARAVRMAYEAQMPECRRYELEISTGLVHLGE